MKGRLPRLLKTSLSTSKNLQLINTFMALAPFSLHFLTHKTIYLYYQTWYLGTQTPSLHQWNHFCSRSLCLVFLTDINFTFLILTFQGLCFSILIHLAASRKHSSDTVKNNQYNLHVYIMFEMFNTILYFTSISNILV